MPEQFSCVVKSLHEFTPTNPLSAQQGVHEAPETELRRLRKILDSLPSGVIELDHNGVVLNSNPVANELLGRELPGSLWRDVVKEVFAPSPDDGHDISLRNGRYVNISTQSLAGEPGQIILIHDVTPTRQLQSQLNRDKRLATIGKMISALAHQVRTPLSSAILFLNNALTVGGTNEIVRQTVSKALSSLRGLEQLVQDMLLFARGSGFEIELVEVETLIRLFQEQNATYLYGKQYQVIITNRATAGYLRVNLKAMLSAFDNLLQNALQASHGQGVLEVTVCDIVKNMLEISFQDNGPGISHEHQANLFEPFYTTKSHGSGLGLAVVDSIIRAHGGRVWFDHTVISGACFRILLPKIQS